MMHLLGENWELKPDDQITFFIEVSLAVGFLILWIILILFRNKHPQFTKNGWIELVIGTICVILKGVFDSLDTIAPDGIDTIFDYMESSFMIVGLILLGIGILRIALYSVKIWEVRQ